MTDKKTLNSLIALEELLKALPERRKDILQNEIRQKENNWYLLRATHRLTRIQVWQSFRTIFWVGLSVFLFFFAIGQAAALAQWITSLQEYTEVIPNPVLREIDLEAFFVPSSSAVTVASGLPQFGILDATFLALIAMVLVLAFKSFIVYTYITQMNVLKKMVHELERELVVLRSWRKETLDEKKKKT